MNADGSADMKLTKILYMSAGLALAGLGTAGIVLPLLPTTPLYLLATLCFAKGSERFHRWFTGRRMYKRHLESFVQARSMTMKTKLCILLPVTAMMLLPFITIDILAMRIVIIALLLTKHWYFIFKIRTERTELPYETKKHH